jgi:hypothetical protein
MTGSVADGEDIVQETLARAYYLLPEMNEMPPFRPWLFRIAHNRALDHLRRYEARMSEPLDAVRDGAADPAPDPGDAIAHQQAVQLAVSRFAGLAPAWLEGREVIAVFRAPGDAQPGYFIELGMADGKVRFIHDFRYVPYIMRDARIEVAPTTP